jgi:hypothetical protein
MNMKLIAAILLTAFLGFVIGLYTQLPWWGFAITSLLVGLAIRQKPWQSFLAAFTGMFLLWVILAFLKDVPNDHLLSTKVAQILPLKGSYILLILITGIIGGLVGGLSALIGSYALRSFKSQNVELAD